MTTWFSISSVLFEAVRDKLDQMVFLWNDIQALLEEREAKLLDVMDLAEKFWCDYCALIVTIKDTVDLLKEQEEPGVDPSVVKQQQESVEVWRLQNQTLILSQLCETSSFLLFCFTVL